MKKLFLVLLAAGLFVACGTKQTDETTAADSTIVEDTIAAPEEAPVAEVTEPAPEAATTVQKPTSTAPATEVKEEPKTEPQPATEEKTTPTKKRR